HALDAVRHVAIGNAFHLKRVQPAKFRDLLEGQRGVFHQPNGCGLGHQRFAIAHVRALVGTGTADPCRPTGEEKCAETPAYSPGGAPRATATASRATLVRNAPSLHRSKPPDGLRRGRRLWP